MIKYSCSLCDFLSTSKYCLEKHFKTTKHIKNTQQQNDPDIKIRCTYCNKGYKEKSGLRKHTNVCKKKNNLPSENNDVIIRQVLEEMNKINTSSNGINNNDVIIRQIIEEIKKDSNLSNVSNNHDLIISQLLEEMKKMNDFSKESAMEMKKMSNMIDDLKENKKQTTLISNNTTINNVFNVNVFLDEKCGNAINFDDFIKNLNFRHADLQLMIDSYVDGTCNILQKNLEELPINKRPLHYVVGEDPYQQLIHIRKDNKWTIESELNWMQQIHADDDDYVVNKNQIYYALKKVDDSKLEFLAYYYHINKDYILQHGRLVREISRPDFKEKVYQKLMRIITLDIDKLDDIAPLQK